jgi:predicted acylesterase/phospholipase RssA/CRP-like cAMP-binding protein
MDTSTAPPVTFLSPGNGPLVTPEHPTNAWVSFLQGTEIFRGLSTDTLQGLADGLTEVSLEAGTFLFRQGEAADAMYVLREGRLIVLAEADGPNARALTMLEVGACVGEGAIIMAGSRSASVRASTPSRLLRVTAAAFEKAMTTHPALRQVISGLVAARLPGLIDASLRTELRSELAWVRLARDEVLFRAGDPGDAVFVVARGRLGAFRDAPSLGGVEELVAEIGAGEPVGEVALLTHEPRSLTVRALRDTELVRLSAQGFEDALTRNPQAIVPIARTLAHRLRAMATGTITRASIRTVAIVPLNPSVPVASLVRGIEAGLRKAGAVLSLSADEFDELHGKSASAATADSTFALNVAAGLGSLEGGHDFILYRCDPVPTPWTRLCLGRADRILIVARAGDPPALGSLQRLVEDVSPSARELILLHDNGDRLPTGTAEWLQAVKPVRHHHVRLDRPDDTARIARFLTGRAVGIVFSGGGARGYAHAGVLRALREERIAIDFVGGVSMGSMPAATHAMGFGDDELMNAFRKVFVYPNRPTKPYTLPVLSVFGMARAEKALQAVFGQTRIEDLWVNYFCVATDITSAQVKVFREGLLWRAMRASGSFPGLFPPVPEGGHLLVDGGLFTNLPVDLMQKLCPGPVIASDVSKDMEMAVDPALTAAPRLRDILWATFNPFAPKLRFPSLASVLSRAIDARESGLRAQLRESTTFCFVPPVARFALDQVGALDEIAAVGYEYAVAKIKEMPASVSRSD